MKLPILAKVLCNLIALLMLGLIGYVVYGSITNTGIWKPVVDLITADSTGRYSPVGAFSICLIAGILPLLIILLFIIWVSYKTKRNR
jgi:hypothetical protein